MKVTLELSDRVIAEAKNQIDHGYDTSVEQALELQLEVWAHVQEHARLHPEDFEIKD